MSRALVVLDIRKDPFPGGEDGARGDAGRQPARGRAARGVPRERRAPVPYQHVFEGPYAPFFAAGSEGAETHPNVAPAEGEPVIVQHSPNAFKDTSLLEDLRGLGVTEVVLCGMMTSMCVDASARAASDHGFATVLAADACAAPDLRSGDELIAGATVHKAFVSAHDRPMPLGTDLTPPGVARLVADMMDALDLRDVTLVGNDTGGAIAQLVAAHHPERLGRLVLTNCDAYETFPPAPLRPVSGFAPSRPTGRRSHPARPPVLRRPDRAHGARGQASRPRARGGLVRPTAS